MSQLIRRVAKKGFTLIELMIVVAIIGILAAIAIPKFADLINKSKESVVKGGLSSLRGALTIYYSDMEGVWPGGLAQLVTAGKYIEKLPTVTLPKNSSGFAGHGANGAETNAVAEGGAIWLYNGAAATGAMMVNCGHVDSKGSTWSSW